MSFVCIYQSFFQHHFKIQITRHMVSPTKPCDLSIRSMLSCFRACCQQSHSAQQLGQDWGSLTHWLLGEITNFWIALSSTIIQYDNSALAQLMAWHCISFSMLAKHFHVSSDICLVIYIYSVHHQLSNIRGRVSKSRKHRERRSENEKFFSFRHWYNTCINVIVFDSGWKLLPKILVISTQKMPANDDLYAFRRTNMPNWSREPNNLKLCLENRNFLDSLIRGTLVGNIIVDHSDVVGALPLCAAPIRSSFLTLGFNGLGKDKDKTRNI